MARFHVTFQVVCLGCRVRALIALESRLLLLLHQKKVKTINRIEGSLKKAVLWVRNWIGSGSRGAKRTHKN